jgi:hypothetical protein
VGDAGKTYKTVSVLDVHYYERNTEPVEFLAQLSQKIRFARTPLAVDRPDLVGGLVRQTQARRETDAVSGRLVGRKRKKTAVRVGCSPEAIGSVP